MFRNRTNLARPTAATEVGRALLPVWLVTGWSDVPDRIRFPCSHARQSVGIRHVFPPSGDGSYCFVGASFKPNRQRSFRYVVYLVQSVNQRAGASPMAVTLSGMALATGEPRARFPAEHAASALRLMTGHFKPAVAQRDLSMDTPSEERYLALKAVMMPRDTNPYGTIFG